MRPCIGITLGDPSGIGPEVIVKALNNKTVYTRCIPVVYGDLFPLQDAISFCKLGLNIHIISNPREAMGEYGTIDLIPFYLVKNGDYEYKKASAKCGDASFKYIINAINDALEKKIDAVCTAPINKEALFLAGHKFSGHTEIFAHYTNTKNYAMLLTSKSLRVIHVTTHISLKDVASKVTKERVLEVIELANKVCKQIGIKKPRIAVAGLNPHSSENGLFGSEEGNYIIPAIEEASKIGIDVDGPVPPDTVFVKALSGMYDIVVAMYHDQGHIPLKLSGFKYNARKKEYTSVNGVNSTLGLPIIRTSVDHGVAYGKAGEGRANEESMIDAIKLAIQFYKNKND